MKKLVIDQIPGEFNFKSDIVLGPWCFKKNISLKDILKNKFKKYYFEDKIDQIRAFKCCEEQYQRLIRKTAIYLKEKNNSNFSINFFENYIGYWLLDFIHLIHYSKRLSSTYKRKFEKKKIELFLKNNNKDFIFSDTADYLAKTYKNTDYFSHFVFLFLNKDKPKNWSTKKLHKDENEILKRGKLNFLSKIKNFFSKIIFSRVCLVYGFNILEKFILSTILLFIKPNIKYNKFYKFNTLLKPSKLLSPISDAELFEYIKKYVPRSFLEISRLKHNFFISCKDKVILGSGSSLLNDKEKFKLLLFRELGGKIISVQHGSAYGDASVSIHHGHEYLFDKFISWGQTSHQNYRTKFVPLPSPQLRNKTNYHKIKSKKNILFVSTSNMFVQPKYLKMRSFNESCKRIRNSYIFLKSIKAKDHSKIFYKDSPYGHFSEKNIFEKQFKKVIFINKKPEQFINNVKLIVMNNYSTFFFKSLSMNIPTILICEKNCWDSTSKAKKLFGVLHNAGIVNYNPKKAAKRVEDNLLEWWYSKKTQKARKLFCNEFALSDKNTFKTWLNFFLNHKL